MITYPLTFPSEPNPTRVRLRLQNVVGASQSPYSLVEQYQRHAGQRWMADVALPALVGLTEHGVWSAFLTALRGRYGTFIFAPPDRNRGSGAGTPVVDGGGQTGEELVTRGWDPSTTGVLLAGDCIQVGSAGSTRLYRVLQDVDSDANGEATLDIWPRLRESPPDGELVITTEPAGLWRLGENIQDLLLEPALATEIEFSIVEAL